MLKNKDNQFAWRFIRCKKVMFLIKESQFKNVYNLIMLPTDLWRYVYMRVLYLLIN